MSLSEDRLESLADQLQKEKIDGKALAKMFEAGEISKGERRKIGKLASKKKAAAAVAPVELTERQKLRLAIKEKKAMPKLSKDERKRKFTQELTEEREEQKSKHIQCLGCRKKGHMLRDCPDKDPSSSSASSKAVSSSGHCFNCGSSSHALRDCPEPNDGKALKFAKCFICQGIGHISKACPENANGLYPQGGCCHICLQKTHLVRDCPERTEEHAEEHRKKMQEEQDRELGPRIGQREGEGGGDDDYFEEAVGVDEDEDEQGGKGAWHKGMSKRKGRK